jgi:hypothetical protein
MVSAPQKCDLCPEEADRLGPGLDGALSVGRLADVGPQLDAVTVGGERGLVAQGGQFATLGLLTLGECPVVPLRLGGDGDEDFALRPVDNRGRPTLEVVGRTADTRDPRDAQRAGDDRHVVGDAALLRHDGQCVPPIEMDHVARHHRLGDDDRWTLEVSQRLREPRIQVRQDTAGDVAQVDGLLRQVGVVHRLKATGELLGRLVNGAGGPEVFLPDPLLDALQPDRIAKHCQMRVEDVRGGGVHQVLRQPILKNLQVCPRLMDRRSQGPEAGVDLTGRDDPVRGRLEGLGPENTDRPFGAAGRDGDAGESSHAGRMLHVGEDPLQCGIETPVSLPRFSWRVAPGGFVSPQPGAAPVQILPPGFSPGEFQGALPGRGDVRAGGPRPRKRCRR